MTKKRRAIFAVAVLALLAIGAIWDELPSWWAGGTHSVMMQPVGPATAKLTCPKPGSALAIYGDSHTNGARMGSGDPFGKVLALTLPRSIDVSFHGVGGHTAAMGETKWLDTQPAADTIIIAYGTNDAAPRGWLGDKESVPIDQFKASLRRLADGFSQGDTRLVLMTPPPGGSNAIAHRLAPYRSAVAAIGEERGIPVIDPARAFAECEASQPLLTSDALHMNSAGHRCLGRWMAAQFCSTWTEN